MGVNGQGKVRMARDGYRGPEMGVKGFGWLWRPAMGVNGLGWVWRGSWNLSRWQRVGWKVWDGYKGLGRVRRAWYSYYL